MIDPFNFLLHCNRLAARKSAQAELLREALSEDFEALVYPAIAVARAERGPIGLILHSILCDHPNPVLCMTLGDSIPVETIVLREFALEVLHQKLRVLATLFDADPVMTSIREILADVPRFELPPNLSISLLGGNPSLKPGIDAPTISDLHLRSLALARTLVDLGTWHQSLGNHEASVGAIQKAERVLRPVFESDQTYLGFYSEVLNSLGAAHFDAGNPGLARELAVRVGQLNADTKRGECAECREAVAVAGLLLSKVLADSNHLPDALCFAESVVKDFMVFYKSDPGRFEHQLPDVMANYVTILRRSGFYKRASLLAQESVQTVNNLVPYSADAFLPQYGKALGSMSESFVITGDLSSAMKAAGVSVVIFEELNSLRPGVFGINYCLSLIQLALASALFGIFEVFCG